MPALPDLEINVAEIPVRSGTLQRVHDRIEDGEVH
jgi:hypothetical protein